MTLEEIARAIGDTYTAHQLPRYLRESGIPEEFIPAEAPATSGSTCSASSRPYTTAAAAARAACIHRRLARGPLPHPPRADVRKRIIALLAAQGWHVDDGRLVVGERTSTRSERSARSAATPESRRCTPTYARWPTATSRAATPRSPSSRRSRRSTTASKTMTGLDLDGAKLMAEAFKDADPPISLADLSSETGKNIQAGFRSCSWAPSEAYATPTHTSASRHWTPRKGSRRSRSRACSCAGSTAPSHGHRLKTCRPDAAQPASCCAQSARVAQPQEAHDRSAETSQTARARIRAPRRF